MPDIHIRKAEPREAAMIAALAKEIWTEHYTDMIGKEQVAYMLRTYQSEDAVAQQILGGTIYYIAFDGKIPCGYSAIEPDHKGLFLSKLYVKDVYRGNGVARVMLSAICSYAKQEGIGRVWLTCNKNNTGSLHAYERLGFCIAGESVKDIGNGFKMDDYVLEIMLDGRPDNFRETVRRLWTKNNTNHNRRI